MSGNEWQPTMLPPRPLSGAGIRRILACQTVNRNFRFSSQQPNTIHPSSDFSAYFLSLAGPKAWGRIQAVPTRVPNCWPRPSDPILADTPTPAVDLDRFPESLRPCSEPGIAGGDPASQTDGRRGQGALRIMGAGAPSDATSERDRSQIRISGLKPQVRVRDAAPRRAPH